MLPRSICDAIRRAVRITAPEDMLRLDILDARLPADKPQSQEHLSKGQGPKSGPCIETVWWRRRGIEPLVQRKTHSDIYKLSRRLHLARRTSTDGVTGGPAD